MVNGNLFQKMKIEILFRVVIVIHDAVSNILFPAGIICILLLTGQTIRLLKYGIKMAYIVENINYPYRSFKHCHEECLGCYVNMD
jgi:hypothetical protein